MHFLRDKWDCKDNLNSTVNGVEKSDTLSCQIRNNNNNTNEDYCCTERTIYDAIIPP